MKTKYILNMPNSKKYRKQLGGTWFLVLCDSSMYQTMWTRDRTATKVLKVEVYDGVFTDYRYNRGVYDPIVWPLFRDTEMRIYVRDNKIIRDYSGDQAEVNFIRAVSNL